MDRAIEQAPAIDEIALLCPKTVWREALPEEVVVLLPDAQVSSQHSRRAERPIGDVRLIVCVSMLIPSRRNVDHCSEELERGPCCDSDVPRLPASRAAPVTARPEMCGWFSLKLQAFVELDGIAECGRTQPTQFRVAGRRQHAIDE